MSYKITGANPDSDGVVSISTTAESAEEAACIAQAWSDHGVRNVAVTDPQGRRWPRLPSTGQLLARNGLAGFTPWREVRAALTAFSSTDPKRAAEPPLL